MGLGGVKEISRVGWSRFRNEEIHGRGNYTVMQDLNVGPDQSLGREGLGD